MENFHKNIIFSLYSRSFVSIKVSEEVKRKKKLSFLKSNRTLRLILVCR